MKCKLMQVNNPKQDANQCNAMQRNANPRSRVWMDSKFRKFIVQDCRVHQNEIEGNMCGKMEWGFTNFTINRKEK